MELVCDQNVADKHYRAFRLADWIAVRRVQDVLPAAAPDSAIIDVARERGWVVFTSDVRFLADVAAGEAETGAEASAAVGVVFYRQLEDPSPGDVLAALRSVARSYDDHSEIREYVPGDWL